jgi:hypothetical protein
MLKAWLHRKLGRATDEDEREPDRSAVEHVFSREDPLTSAVFERLAYLEPAEAWSLLMAACEGQDRTRIQESAPAAIPLWSFWPRLLPGAGGTNVRRVEPDVVILWGDWVLVIEAKHGGAQNSAQWVEEIRAVCADPLFAGKRLVLVAAGGVGRTAFEEQAAQARQTLNDEGTLYLLLRWGSLREASELRHVRATPGAAAILRDLIAALESWGYRSRVDFESLPRVQLDASLQITAGPENLVNWSVK